jgi:hypothetical protein
MLSTILQHACSTMENAIGIPAFSMTLETDSFEKSVLYRHLSGNFSGKLP